MALVNARFPSQTSFRNGKRSKRATHRVSDPRHVCASIAVCEAPCVVTLQQLKAAWQFKVEVL
jgi:hypothetical protein